VETRGGKIRESIFINLHSPSTLRSMVIKIEEWRISQKAITVYKEVLLLYLDPLYRYINIYFSFLISVLGIVISSVDCY
jgi:hypothetical protein